MPEIAGLARTNAGRVPRQSRSPALVVLSAFAVGLASNVEISSRSMLVMGTVASTAHAQPAESARRQLRAKIKSAAEELNGIVSAAPDMIRAMFAGNTPSAACSLDKIRSPRKLDLKVRFSLQMRAERWSADESKELARLGNLPKRPVLR